MLWYVRLMDGVENGDVIIPIFFFFCQSGECLSVCLSYMDGHFRDLALELEYMGPVFGHFSKEYRAVSNWESSRHIHMYMYPVPGTRVGRSYQKIKNVNFMYFSLTYEFIKYMLTIVSVKVPIVISS